MSPPTRGATRRPPSRPPASINRTDWGLTWNANLEKGGVLVSEKIKLVLDVQLAKQA